MLIGQSQQKINDLRERAEEMLQMQIYGLRDQEPSDKDIQSLIHELQVHQIELEMQNEELRTIQEEAEEAHNRYIDLYDFAPVGYFTFDNKGLILGVNLTGARRLGAGRNFLINTPFSLYIAQDSRHAFYQHIRQVFEINIRQICELKLVDKNNNQFDARLESLAVQDSKGNFSQCRTVISDINERKRTEEALLENEARYRELAESIGEVFYALDRELRYTYWNNTSEALTGISAKDAAGKSLFELFPELKGSRAEKLYREVLKTQRPKHFVNKYQAQGKNLVFEINAYPSKFGLSIIAKDITEQKHAEEIVREQAGLLDKARDAIIVQDLEDRITYWNKSAERIYGWTAEEAVGKNPDELIYKGKPPRLIEAKEKVIEKGEWMGELRQRTKDGKEIIIESRWTLVHDNQGKPVSKLIINTDITQKKKLESQLLHAQRMESIGTLAGGIAHDLNNLLTPIMLSLQILKERFTDEQNQQLLNILEKNSQRGADLIKQVLSFARGIEGEQKPLQAGYLIAEIEKIIKQTFPRYIEIQTNIQKDLWTILGDATQLNQVMMNLCVNARDAMPYGGVLKITASNFLIDENDIQTNAEAKIGPYIVISVSDVGMGIPPEILDKIFEPFFTTKESGKGTGLGLSIAHGIVKSHDGFIDVDSKVGQGTTFRVFLPAVETKRQEPEMQQPELSAGHGECILIAEDEDSIREITCSTLEANGYEVLRANNGAEAVVQYTLNRDRIKVILMDMMMPVMDGQESIRVIRRVNPGVKIIVVSGLADKDKLARIAENHVQVLLPKPYTVEGLLRTIHEVLSTK